MQETLVIEQPLLRQAQQLQDQQQWSEARLLADFVQANPKFGDAAEAGRMVGRIDRELDSYWGQVQRFAQGAMTGEPYDTASFLGSLSLDFFVIGDIRDLVVQGWKRASGEEADEIILAL